MNFISDLANATPLGDSAGLVVVGGLLASLAAFVFVFRRGRAGNSAAATADPTTTSAPLEETLPYRPQSFFLSKAERSFYEMLRRLVGHGHVVFAKVRLANLVSVPRGTDAWQKHFDRIHPKHIDFVVCEAKSMRVRLAIELNDSPSFSDEPRQRDLFLDGVFAAVGLPLIRLRPRPAYGQTELRQILAALLIVKAATEPASDHAGEKALAGTAD